MALSGQTHLGGQRLVLLSPLTIAAAVAATATTPVTKLAGMTSLTVTGVFLYGAGGTTADVRVQTSLDGGLSWIDIIALGFLTTAVMKYAAVTSLIAPAAQAATALDGTLTVNTVINGVLGDRLRLKYVTTGTYTGATSLAVYGIVK